MPDLEVGVTLPVLSEGLSLVELDVTPMPGHNETDPLVFTLEDAIQVAEFAKQNNRHQVAS